jgi:hypothetical protein
MGATEHYERARLKRKAAASAEEARIKAQEEERAAEAAELTRITAEEEAAAAARIKAHEEERAAAAAEATPIAAEEEAAAAASAADAGSFGMSWQRAATDYWWQRAAAESSESSEEARPIKPAKKRPSSNRHILDNVGITPLAITPLAKKRHIEEIPRLTDEEVIYQISLLTYEEVLTSVVVCLGNNSLANLANTCPTIYPVAMSAHKFHLVTHEPGGVEWSTPIADLGKLLRPRSCFCKCKIGQRSWFSWQTEFLDWLMEPQKDTLNFQYSIGQPILFMLQEGVFLPAIIMNVCTQEEWYKIAILRQHKPEASERFSYVKFFDDRIFPVRDAIKHLIKEYKAYEHKLSSVYERELMISLDWKFTKQGMITRASR